MQYELILTGKFKKSLKLAKKRVFDLKLLDKVISMLQNDIPLEEKLSWLHHTTNYGNN